MVFNLFPNPEINMLIVGASISVVRRNNPNQKYTTPMRRITSNWKSLRGLKLKILSMAHRGTLIAKRTERIRR
jgi:hypothetical protein